MSIKVNAEIVLRNPKDLVPYVKNAKIHSPEQIDRLAGQIAAFGFDQPIVVDKNNVIIKGHGRREAALKLNMDQVPVIVSEMDEYEAMASRIADNKVASNEYNTEVMKFDLGTLHSKGFDLRLTGMSQMELRPLTLELNGEMKRETIGQAPDGEYTGSEGGEPGPVTDIMPTESGEPGAEGEGSFFMDRNPVIQYNVVFDDKGQQDQWTQFLKLLKDRYPELETIASRLLRFVNENVASLTSPEEMKQIGDES